MKYLMPVLKWVPSVLLFVVAGLLYQWMIRGMELTSSRRDAVIAIEKLGGVVKQRPYGEVRGVYFNKTRITDADLVHLKELTDLSVLKLDNTNVTDAGLVHLKGMRNLHSLSLNDTKVTDAGLVHLKGLTSLTTLELHDTQVTKAGVKELQTALPNCRIYLD